MRRAQIEIVGLLVIVILISLMLFFGMIFLLDANESAGENTFQDEFQDSLTLDNFPIVLFDTQVPYCISRAGNVKSMKLLMEDCFLETDFTCSIEVDEISPCEAFNATLENITEQVFEDFGYSVYINVSRGDNNQMTDLDIGDCRNRSDAYIEKSYPLSIARRPPAMLFKMRICP